MYRIVNCISKMTNYISNQITKKIKYLLQILIKINYNYNI